MCFVKVPPNPALDEAADALIRAWELYGSDRLKQFVIVHLFVCFLVWLFVCLVCVADGFANFFFLVLSSCSLFSLVRLMFMIKGCSNTVFMRGKHFYHSLTQFQRITFAFKYDNKSNYCQIYYQNNIS